MIPNQWYAILRTLDVRRRPVAVRRLGENLVLFRDTRGTLNCLQDRCPHKGAKLSTGVIRGDNLACGYHGFEYDGEGACRHMPVIGREGRVPKKMCTRSFRVRERFGFIWLWWGDDREDAALPEIRIFDDFVRPVPGESTYGWESPVHYTRYVESLTDVYHVPFVHAASRWNLVDPKGGRIDHFEYEVNGPLVTSKFLMRHDDDWTDEQSIRTWRPWRRGWLVGLDLLMPNMNYIKTHYTNVMAISTPIDDERTWVMVRYAPPHGNLVLPVWLRPPRIPLLGRVFGKLASWFFCRFERWGAQAQDMRIVTTQSPKISEMGVNQFSPADRLNIEFLRMRDRLKTEATLGAVPANTSLIALRAPARTALSEASS
jgi:nitrite reductase/ring-hydroxylating ferredoxin subunit